MSDFCEGANFLLLQKRYVKIFLSSYNRQNYFLQFPFTAAAATKHDQQPKRAMCFIDSDFDSQDEEFGDDIEEIISNQDVLKLHQQDFVGGDSSDEIHQVEALQDF